VLVFSYFYNYLFTNVSLSTSYVGTVRQKSVKMAKIKMQSRRKVPTVTKIHSFRWMDFTF
jgi:hypothetical protein